MNLIIDIGNTRVKLGIFENRNFKKKWIVGKAYFSTDHIAEIENDFPINKIILINSGELPESVLSYLVQKDFFLVLDSDTPLPIQNNYGSPQTLGKDRLASAVAAKTFFPSEACLVIDCGTCITYNFVSAEGVFLGGNITPGLSMRFNAMHQLTAKLPLIERANIDNLIGDTTETAIRTGAQLGAAFEMDGFIDNYIQRFGEIRTLLTGGDADYFAKHLKNKIFALENLVLTGLNEILIFNTDHK
jgi:type III pantothenate kinase